MVQRSEGAASGGQDVALGPNVGATPLSALGPALVLQYLIAGSMCQTPAMSAAALPLVSASLAIALNSPDLTQNLQSINGVKLGLHTEHCHGEIYCYHEIGVFA